MIFWASWLKVYSWASVSPRLSAASTRSSHSPSSTSAKPSWSLTELPRQVWTKPKT